MDLKHIDRFNDWDKWKKTIAGAVNLGHTVGMSDETIEKIGDKIGNMLSATVDPENREQRVLQELWKAGDDKERHSLTSMLVKLAQKES